VGAAGCVTLAVLGVTLRGVPAFRAVPAAAAEPIRTTVPAPVAPAVPAPDQELVTVLADATALQPLPAAFTTNLPDGWAAVAIRAALAQIGLPSMWGGDGPMNG
jgi:cell wall-associated NlpC family hydrolase